MAAHNKLLALLCSVLSGVSIALAFIYPLTYWSAVLGFASAYLLIHMAYLSEGSYVLSYLAGIVAYATGVYWLVDTISIFGNFPYKLSLFLYCLYVLLDASEFLFFAFFYRNLRPAIKAFPFLASVSFVLTELTTFRIFPWQYAHSQAKVLPLIQFADVAGALGVTFVVFFAAEILHSIVIERKLRLAHAVGLLFIGCVLGYGVLRVDCFQDGKYPTAKVALIQGNISIPEKYNRYRYDTNVNIYIEQSLKYVDTSDLIIWPETVINEPLPDELKNKSDNPILSRLPDGVNFLVGSLTSSGGRTYNSVFPVYRDGTVASPDHKRILMPFGEYVPFADRYPVLLELAHMGGQLSPGNDLSVFSFQSGIKLSPLNCYEDVIPSLARDAAVKGANLLANVTNDAWFGQTAAPYQHNVLALFRAVENRRTLVRVANTGYTGVINPIGRVIRSLPLWTRGDIEVEVSLVNEITFYSTYGDALWWAVCGIACAYILFRWTKAAWRKLSG